MSQHLSESTLQRWLDGELSGSDRGAAEWHLAECVACRTELQALEEAFATVARGISHLEPPAASLDLAHAALWRRLRGRWGLHVPRYLPRAAVFLIATAGIASATIPGSPVRRWAESLWQEPHAAELHQPGAMASAADPSGEAGSAGVGIDPVDGELRVLVERSSPELQIRVRLAEQARMSVRGIGEAAGARFRMGRGRVSVEEAGSGELEVVIPQSAPRASITVDGRRVLLKEGEALRLFVPADSVGTDIIFPAHF